MAGGDFVKFRGLHRIYELYEPRVVFFVIHENLKKIELEMVVKE